ncbi:L-histidine N(alpha)-methyltransferase [Alloactinosynnema sp. L-07]|uniref:L-histidine N(alpha)-methyltransferase n=1 Tax=Alloactinosynnema sp. L-07 TaxID=1653480 RepID=UPI0006B54881|nr:L-histidine N(alpha)-methyltransferase [Alloactinosynnema sp. L-07]
MTADERPVIGDLARAIDESDFAWSLVLVGEDQSSKLASLTSDLRGRPSATGEGKQITSGYQYWGIGPTIAWAHACSDPFYQVMKQSLESFTRRWRRISGKVGGAPFHYVCLGAGTGHKDRQILATLLADNPDLFYFPVDISSEMLRLGASTSTSGLGMAGHRIVPVQLDFAIHENLVELGTLLRRVVGDEPILYSLVGNTMANFDDDAETLASLTAMMRPQDLFLLEVATTDDLSDDLARQVVEEYARSRAYKEFVTSALMHNSDLTIDMESVQFRGSVEPGRALKVKVIYQNRTGGDIQMMLPDRTRVLFPDNDTILLQVTRKYARKALDEIFAKCGLRRVAATHSDFRAQRVSPGFGMELVLLRRTEGDPAPAQQRRTRADEIWAN